MQMRRTYCRHKSIVEQLVVEIEEVMNTLPIRNLKNR